MAPQKARPEQYPLRQAAGLAELSASTGVVGAVAGTLLGKEFRVWLAGALKADRPAAFIEDAIAICCACLVALAIS